jgi:capsular exopolysaccharide synthesis family protein
MSNPSRIKKIPLDNMVADEKSLCAEQFRKIRSVLNVHYLANSLRSLLVTSLAPQEGKTTVSLELAATLAKGLNAPVILIDADLRRKGLSYLLGLVETPGLTEVLEGKENFKKAIIDTDIEGLKILPAGSHSPNCAELVASKGMRDFIEKLRMDFKDFFLIIDSAPFLPASDAQALSYIVDGIVLVILADQTRRDVLKREINAINKKKIIGVVLNNAEFEMSHHYHGYYRDYYGREHKK